jgi:hypothetical protein
MNKYKNDPTEIYEILIDNNYFTQEELDLITNINGFNVETLNDCIYARYGFHDLAQLIGEESEEE